MAVPGLARKHLTRGGLLALVVCAIALAGGGSKARALTGTYTIALIQVSYSDVSIHRYTQTALTQAAGEIERYFGALSNTELTMRVRVGRATLPRTRAYYWPTCAAGATNCPPDLFQAAVNGAIGNGLSMAGVRGVAIVDPLLGWNGTQLSFGVNWTNGPRPVSVSGSPMTVQQSWLSEDCGPSGCPGEGFTAPGASAVYWNAWAHELGHQIQNEEGSDFGGEWNGHPGGYSSGYDLMDSGYPDGESVVDLTWPRIPSNRKLVFPGWLPESHVTSMPAPGSGTSTLTFTLAAIGLPSASTTRLQGIRLPIQRGIYYTIDARRRVGPDTNLGGGIWDEGVQIQYVDEGQNPQVRDIDACDYTLTAGCVRSSADSRYANCQSSPRSYSYCWPYYLWHVGSVPYRDVADAITIEVVGQNPSENTYQVRVTRGVPSGAPNMSITPWLTPPGNTWETKDIWVDSSCNGYGVYRYGIDSSTGLPRGNGDDPCANHPNRLYARVTNIGTRPAANVRVSFSRSNPLGVGVGPDTGWSGIGEANEGVFPVLASVDPGGHADVWVEWTPTVDTSRIPDSTSFAFHSCVRVRILSVPGETSLGNNEAQENIGYFQASTTGGPRTGPKDVTAVLRSIYLKNVDTKPGVPPRTYYFSSEARLPPDGYYAVAGGARSVTLAPGDVRTIPIKVVIPDSEPAGKFYSLDVSAWTIVTRRNPAITRRTHVPQVHREGKRVGGDRLVVHTVLPSSLALTALFAGEDQISVTGALSPPHTGAKLTLDYLEDGVVMASRLVRSDENGDFKDGLSGAKGGKWTVRAIWAGDVNHSSALETVPVGLAGLWPH